MEVIYNNPWLTTWFIMSIGFWVAVAAYAAGDTND